MAGLVISFLNSVIRDPLFVCGALVIFVSLLGFVYVVHRTSFYFS